MRRHRGLVALVVFASVLLLPGLGRHDLWNPDEPRYAEVTREMIVTGNYLVPHLSGRPYAEKPPLFFWTIAGAAALTGGLDELAVRLPSFLAAVGTTVLVVLLAGIYFESRAALVSGLVYLTSLRVWWQSQTGQIDMLLGFWVALALYLWARGRARPATERSSRAAWGFWLVTGLATLTKGPVGLLPPLLVVIVYLAWERDREGFSRLGIAWGLPVALGIVLAWVVPAALEGGRTYFETLVFKQNVTRYADPWGHVKPWYYYLEVLPADFFPWILCLPGALLSGRRNFVGSERQGYRFALVWVVVTLLFFSFSAGKRSVYVFQMFPALAILVGAGLVAWWRDRRVGAGWFAAPWFLVAVLFAALAVAFPGIVVDVPEARWFPTLAGLMPWLLVGFAGWASVVAVGFLSRHGRGAFVLGTAVVGLSVLYLVAAVWALPRFDRVKSNRVLGETVASLVEPEERLGMFPHTESGLLFYAKRHVEILCSPEEVHQFVNAPDRPWLLAELEMLDRVRPRLPLELLAQEWDRGGFGLFRRGDGIWAESDTVQSEPGEIRYGYPCRHP